MTHPQDGLGGSHEPLGRSGTLDAWADEVIRLMAAGSGFHEAAACAVIGHEADEAVLAQLVFLGLRHLVEARRGFLSRAYAAPTDPSPSH